MTWGQLTTRLRKKTLPKESDRHREGLPPDCSGLVDLGRLRRVLAALPANAWHGDEPGVQIENPVEAAVLFPIVLREKGTTVLLTQRTAHLRDHAGQISFPGGQAESGDLSPTHTALREAEEEIGLSSAHVEVVGTLPEYLTVTGYRITPVVAFLTPPFSIRPDPSEVAEVFEVPLAFLMNPENHQRQSREIQGETRNFFAMPYGRHFIWGATAGIIVSLARALAL